MHNSSDFWGFILFSEKLKEYIRLQIIKISRLFKRIIRFCIFSITYFINRGIKISKSALEKLVMRGIVRHLLNYQHLNQESFNISANKNLHFLILRDNDYGVNPDQSESYGKIIVDDGLLATQLATFDTFLWNNKTLFPLEEWKLLETCREVQPDAIILLSTELSIETIRFLRKDWKIPIIEIWYDTCWNGFWESIQEVMPYVDVHVVPDNPLLNFLDTNKGERYHKRFLPLWAPFDPLIYNDAGCNRDINVSFSGQIDGYRSYRMQYIQHLMENNIPVYCSLTKKNLQPTYSKYLEILKRSKIALNFSYSVDSHQLKGRIFEAMLCGALLMESENPQTQCYFLPGIDYVGFNSKEDLVAKIKYYLEHEDERAKIAAQGKQKVQQYYNHILFWEKVINKLEEVQELPL